MTAADDTETRLDRHRPRLIERTAPLRDSSLDISVDDLPAPPVLPRQVDLAELYDALRYQLRRVEALAMSAGRELATVTDATGVDRALHLITASLDATRTALRAIDAREERLRAAR